MTDGLTHIPKVHQLLHDFFNGMQLNDSIDLDGAVTHAVP